MWVGNCEKDKEHVNFNLCGGERGYETPGLLAVNNFDKLAEVSEGHVNDHFHDPGVRKVSEGVCFFSYLFYGFMYCFSLTIAFEVPPDLRGRRKLIIAT